MDSFESSLSNGTRSHNLWRVGLVATGCLVASFGDFLSLVLSVHQCFKLFEEFSVVLVQQENWSNSECSHSKRHGH